ncbi:MAG: WD40 repeat domain-containing protein [Kofleriaceae bacterium]
MADRTRGTWLVMAMCGGVAACGGAGGDGRTIEVPEGRLWGARFSPDGATLAVAFGADDRIGTVDVGAGVLTERATGGSYLTGTAWTADGARIYYTGGAGVFAVDLAGGAPVMVNDAFAALGLDLSPDGTRLAYGTNGSSARVYDLGAGTEAALDRPCQAIRFAPDGARVACVSGGALVTLDLATGAATTVVADGLPFIVGLDWFADGQRLVVTTDAGLEEITLAGRRTVLVDAFAAIEVDLSADDRQAVYLTNGAPGLTLVDL